MSVCFGGSLFGSRFKEESESLSDHSDVGLTKDEPMGPENI